MRCSTNSVVKVSNISKWFGNLVAVNAVSFDVYPGITGLLGPNGAGKTTTLKIIEGLVKPSKGSVTILGNPTRNNPKLYEQVGIMSEHDAIYGFQTGRQFIEFIGRLHNVKLLQESVDLAIDRVGLTGAQHRRLSEYSKGMRQRIRLAAAIVHKPEVLILDEPLSGTDPYNRIQFHDLMKTFAEEGRTVIISSHILEEVESIADQILLMVGGKLAAAGDYRAIRRKLDEQPYTIKIATDKPRQLAATFVAMEIVDSVAVSEDGSVVVRTRDIDTLGRSVAKVARDQKAILRVMEPIDDSLESVFRYIVEN